MKLFTESWLDLTLSDPLRHSAAACNIVWQVDHHTDLVKYQTRIARFPCFKTPEHFKDISHLPKTPRFTLASKTTAIFIIERKKKSSKVSSKVSPVVQSSPVNTNTPSIETFVETGSEVQAYFLLTSFFW